MRFRNIAKYLSVRPSSWNNSFHTARIFIKFDISKSVKGFEVSLKSDKNAVILHQDFFTFMIILR